MRKGRPFSLYIPLRRLGAPALLRSINCGVDKFYRRMFTIVVTSTESQRREWLEETRKTIDSFMSKEALIHGT